MKIVFTIALLLLVVNTSFAQQNRNGLYFIYDPSECQNCITEELNFAINYYQLFPQQVFFVVENDGHKQKLEFLVGKLENKINSDQILIDENLFGKYVKHPLQLFEKNKFSSYNLGSDLSQFFKLSIQVDRVKKSIETPKRINGFRYNLMLIDSNEIDVFYEELGAVYSLNDTIDLVSQIDTFEVLSALHLNATDMKLTFDEIKQKNNVTQSLFQLLSPVASNEKDFLYFSTMVTYSHQLTSAEIMEIRLLSKKYNKMLSNAENEGITMLKHELFISKFDTNFNYIESYIVGNPPNGYDKDYVSHFFKNGDSFIGNLNWYKTDSIQKMPYPTYGHYTLKDDSIRFQRADNFDRPIFYEKKGFDNNCANTTFNIVENNAIYQYVSYPCVIDVTNHIRYEIPMKDMQAICKIEKQKFHANGWLKYYNLGLIHLDKNMNLLLLRANRGEQIYFGLFNAEGNYLGYGKLDQKIPMKATTTLNGELINILDNEIQYLNIAIHE